MVSEQCGSGVPYIGPWRGVIEEYADLLPITSATPRLTLLEGGTPLIESVHIGPSLPGNIRLYLKYEGLNPTGSFKDRGMVVAIAKAVEEGARATICASTGNTAAAAAAYSSRAGIPSIVVIPHGYIALGKLAQTIRYGAKVVAAEGNFDDCLRVVRDIVTRYPIALVNSLNPYRMDGQKTAAFEVVDALGTAPDYHALPVGNAGNVTAYWWGYCHYREIGMIDLQPRMLGFQAEGAAPLVRGEPVPHPETRATAIRIGNPARWRDAMRAIRESRGHITTVTEDEIQSAYSRLAAEEGLFVEPASAASVAGVIRLAQNGFFDTREKITIVCTLTGHGLKDPTYALEILPPLEPTPPEAKAVLERAGALDSVVEASVT
ncbi:MAG: threonine synthase [Candidatus Zipacnadales bacterium]